MKDVKNNTTLENHVCERRNQWVQKIRNIECPLKNDNGAYYDIEITYCATCGENCSIKIL